LLFGHGITQRTSQTLEEGCLEQEVPDGSGLTLQYFFDQVVDDVAVISGKGTDEARDVVSPAHRERRS
jgi:hypothetical protein